MNAIASFSAFISFISKIGSKETKEIVKEAVFGQHITKSLFAYNMSWFIVMTTGACFGMLQETYLALLAIGLVSAIYYIVKTNLTSIITVTMLVFTFTMSGLMALSTTAMLCVYILTTVSIIAQVISIYRKGFSTGNMFSI